jgi:hypothetical protein
METDTVSQEWIVKKLSMRSAEPAVAPVQPGKNPIQAVSRNADFPQRSIESDDVKNLCQDLHTGTISHFPIMNPNGIPHQSPGLKQPPGVQPLQ